MTDREALKLALESYLCREMPAMTVIGDPKWWASKIANFIQVAQPAQRPWVGLTDDERKSVCRVGPVYSPDGVVTRKPLEYRRELEEVALMAVRQAEAKLKEKNT